MAALRELTTAELLRTGIDAQEAADVAAKLARALADRPQPGRATAAHLAQLWQRVYSTALRPDHPFAVHKLMFETTYQAWDAGSWGPPPAWVPTPGGMAATNAARFMRSWQGCAAWREQRAGDPGSDWDLLQRLSFSSPEAFWPHLLHLLGIRFHHPPHRVLEPHSDPDRVCWLPGARFNIAECALSGGKREQPAIVWANEAAPTTLRSCTYGQLADRSAQVAAALRSSGLQPGDAVAINMAMGHNSVAALLGIVLAGCVAVCIADSFSAAEIASRCRIAGPRLILTQDVILRGGHGLPLYQRVVEASGPPAVVLPAAGGRLQVQMRAGDRSWSQFLAEAAAPASLQPHVACSSDAALILFSSGTTGKPKAIPWSHVTPLRCAANAFFHQDVRPGDVVCWPTSMGWMLGPWLVFASLLSGATAALFQGSPQGAAFGAFVQAAGVTMLGVVPSLVRGWRASGCMRGLDWSCIRSFSSAGEASAPDDVLWLMAQAGYKPVIDSCGGTEIGGSFLTGSQLQPQRLAAFSTPAVGHCPAIMVQEPGGSTDISIHGDERAVTGELAILAPALGASQRLLNADHSLLYYEGMPALPPPWSAWRLRRHGDEFERLPGGCYRALGRVDDTMNLGGIKVGSVELERACVEGVEGVLEAAAVAAPTPGGGPEQLFLFLVLRPGTEAAQQQLQQQCQAAISGRLNPLFRVHKVLLRRTLPRNANNKLVRAQLKAELLSAKSKL